MNNQIQRLRYYDGEYLRSYDFADEQAYHLEMRRRLNLKLHLYGIVHGLKLIEDQDSLKPDAVFYSISPGMAIDQLGREIYLSAPYSLSYENILKRPGLANADFELWLCYSETQTGLPAAGYRDCNEKDQQTRWQESFEVVLKRVESTSKSVTPPNCGGVRLGTVTLDDKNGWHVSAVDKQGRVYVGIRAQSVLASNEVDTEDFEMTKVNVNSTVSIDERAAPAAYVDVKPSVFERGNLIVEQNLVIGDDFELKKKDHPNLPDDIPKTGNLKVTSDLFVKGEFYGFLDGEWYGLKQYLQTLIPEIQTDTQILDIKVPNNTPNNSGVVTFMVPCHLPHVTDHKALLSILEIEWQDPKILEENWLAPKISGTSFKIGVSVDNIEKHTTDNNYDLTIRWTIDPPVLDPGSAGAKMFPVSKLKINYVVFFQP